jgi:polar amino acid transport system substrate-binding protein
MGADKPRRLRAILVALVALLPLAGLAACGAGDAPASGGSGGNGREVTVAVTPTMPYIGLEQGKLTGLDGDLFNRAAAELGLRVKPVAVDFPGLLAGVQSHRYDLGIGGISWNAERAGAGIFTDPPYYSPVILAEKPGIGARTVQDLEGKKLATVQSFFYIPALRKVPNASLQTYPNFQAVLQDLDAGRVDIAFLDPLTVVYTKKKNPSLKYETSPLEPPTAADLAAHPEYTAFQPSMSGWYLNKDEGALRDALTKQILGFYQDGSGAETVRKWGGDPSALLKPIPDFTGQRTKVDRPAGWTPPSS